MNIINIIVIEGDEWLSERLYFTTSELVFFISILARTRLKFSFHLKKNRNCVKKNDLFCYFGIFQQGEKKINIFYLFS